MVERSRSGAFPAERGSRRPRAGGDPATRERTEGDGNSPTSLGRGPMSDEQPAEARTDLDGLSIDRAVDAVAEGAGDAGELRETLAIVAEDGVVRRAAVDDAVANASMVATTAETRTELAGEKLSDVCETATPVADLPLVSARLDDYDARLDAVEDRSAPLGDAIQEILDSKADGDLYEIARRIRRVTNAASDVQRAADDLQFELDSFEGWLTDADQRTEELRGDIDALAESVDELDDTADALADDGAGPDRDPASTWVAATTQHRVAGLMITDLRAELAALRTWAAREEGTESPPDDVDARLDAVESTHEAVGDRLAACADPEWTAAFDDRLASLDERLSAMEPPVEWGEVEAVVAEHRPADGR